MEVQLIQNKIYFLREQKIMLDSDLAELYGIETKRLKEAVKRNINRFPLDFMFKITKEENEVLRTQIATLEIGKGKHSKYLPFAFTEQGIAMLSSILNSDKAIEINIYIMRTFVVMRNFALTYEELTKRLNELDGNYSDIYEALNFLMEKDKMTKTQNKRIQIGY